MGFISLLNQKTPIMPWREDAINAAYQALTKFGIVLVAVFNGSFVAAGTSPHRFTLIGDDLLLYAVIPSIAKFLHLNIEQSTTLFFKGYLLIALALAFLAMLLYFKNILSKCIAIFFILCLIKQTILWPFTNVPLISDVYTASIAIPLALLPLFLYLHDKGKTTIFYIFFLFFSGIVMGYGHYLRSFSSVPTALFIFGYLLFDSRLAFTKRLRLLVYIFIGMSIAIGHFHYLIHKRNMFLAAHSPNYHINQLINRHQMWHSVYIGLGYYPNPYNISYKDEIAYQKAQSTNPNVIAYSREYNQILKQSVYGFVSSHLAFTSKIIFKKTRDCLLQVKFYIWAGILLLFIFQNKLYQRLVSAATLIFSMMPGILVIPTKSYISGFIAFSFIYAALGYGHLLTFLFAKFKNKVATLK